MTPLKLRPPILLACLAVLAACDAAEGVPLEELPALERPSPEHRAGLPEVSGVWSLAGVELPGADTTAATAAARGRAVLRIETQRLDSLAAVFVAPGVRLPLVGEVRRDGTVALGGRGPDGQSLIFAGHLRGDTLWAEIVEPSAAAPWPAAARAALVRGTPGPRFARRRGGGFLYLERPPAPPRPDSPLAVLPGADSLADSAAVRPRGVPVPAPRAAPPPAGARTPPAAPAPRPQPPAEEPERIPAPELPDPDSLLPARRDPVSELPPVDPEPDTLDGAGDP